MIVIFLVDTSASMNQKFSNGMSALECTKSGIEHMVKHLPQVKPADKHNDKFLLVTYEEGPGCIKSSFKDPLPHLIKELKVLKAQDMSNPGMSLSTVFDLLSAYRVYHSIDTPGNGRFPGSIEPCVILWFTDGGNQSSPAGVFDRLNIPGITSAGADYYHEPFRWDQRLYTIFLEPNADVVDPQLSILSNVMGGASYRVRTMRHMLQAMDCMLGISKIPPTQYSPQAVLHIYAIVVNFEDLIVDPRRPNTVNHHQLVYIPPGWLTPQNRHAGFFPIPEPYWPDTEAARLPTRNAQPSVHFHTKEEKSIDIPEGFPYDKYGVAPCPMTQELLTRPPGTCWPVYIKNSYKTEGFGFPFGFLKANTHKNAVTLTVVAYNYPALFTLLVHLNSLPNRMPNQEWQQDFKEYLSHTPSYYYTPLRNALRRMNINNVMPADQGSLNQVISRQLGKNKLQAKTELDRLLSAEKADVNELLLSKKKALSSNPFDALRSNSIAMLNDLKRPFFKALQASTTTQMVKNGSKNGSSFQFAQSRFGAPRMDMTMDSDDLHSLPIADMGIYQDRMQKLQQENLRDPFRDEESVKSLQRTMFGNPYKQDKKVSIDEEDEASAADSASTNSSTSGSSWSSILGRRRKPRRRSVSPAHFPVERIPSLSHGDRAVSGKIQTILLGPAGSPGSLPMLRIMVQESFGKSAFTDDESEGLIRPIGMHDGEDEDEEDDDFRRAMFNSDEMEMDVDDEARLRADTPMPGGIGMDDDEEDMEDLQRAQDNIPPPIIPVSLDDIEDAGMRFPERDGSVSSMDHMMDEDYHKHRQGIKRDLEHLNGSASPVFESLVYDPNSLMELQSIPKMLPERSQAGSVLLQNGSEPQSLQDVPVLPAGAGLDGPVASIASSSSLGLMPIPILLPPSDNLPSTTSVPTLKPTEIVSNDHAMKAAPQGIKEQDVVTPSTFVPPLTKLNGKLPTTSISAGSTPTPLGSSPSALAPSRPSNPLSSETMTESPSEFRIALVKQLRMPPRSYDERTVVRMVQKVEGADNWSLVEKRRVLVGCRDIANGLRRVAVASVLDLVEDKLK
ncbi:Integrator complex subunit 6 [Podila clonocystis]|nr:Integrator complex subunit 6 [Podila clonocystis]